MQVVVQIEAFEKAFTHIIGNSLFFRCDMHKINRPLCGV